jgi:Holliday junction resolvase
MNSRTKGKRGELEFSALLRAHGFDARRGQQFSGSPDSPDVVSAALPWLHIEVKRVEHLNLAEACAQAKRDAGAKPWIVAHRKNRGPWMITLDSDALYELLRQSLSHFDLWPFSGPRFVTLDAELFFQFLREIQRRRFTDEFGYVVPEAEAKRVSTPVLYRRQPQTAATTDMTAVTDGANEEYTSPKPSVRAGLATSRGEGDGAGSARRATKTISSPLVGGSATGNGSEKKQNTQQP